MKSNGSSLNGIDWWHAKLGETATMTWSVMAFKTQQQRLILVTSKV